MQFTLHIVYIMGHSITNRWFLTLWISHSSRQIPPVKTLYDQSEKLCTTVTITTVTITTVTTITIVTITTMTIISSITKIIQSHNLGHKVLVTKFQSPNFGHKISVTKF